MKLPRLSAIGERCYFVKGNDVESSTFQERLSQQLLHQLCLVRIVATDWVKLDDPDDKKQTVAQIDRVERMKAQFRVRFIISLERFSTIYQLGVYHG